MIVLFGKVIDLFYRTPLNIEELCNLKKDVMMKSKEKGISKKN
jgi:hypothetical protein